MRHVHGHWKAHDTEEHCSEHNGQPPGCTAKDVDMLQSPFNGGTESPIVFNAEFMKEANVLGNIVRVGLVQLCELFEIDLLK